MVIIRLIIILFVVMQLEGSAQTTFIEFPQTCDFIFTDDNGLIYLSSTRGLYIYDGSGAPKRMKLQGLDNVNIQSNIYPDNTNSLWFTTYNRLVRYEKHTGATSSYQIGIAPGDTLISNYHIFDIDQDRQTIWLKENDRIYEHNTNTRASRLVIDSISGKRILSTKLADDQIVLLDYYYTQSPSIVFMDKGVGAVSKWINWPIKYMATDMILLEPNNVIIGTNRGLYLGNIRQRKVHPLPFKEFSSGVLAIGKYNGRSWIVSTKDERLYLLTHQAQTGTFEIKLLDLFPAPGKIKRIIKSDQGTIFLSSYDHGIYYFNPENIKFNNVHHDAFADLGINKAEAKSMRHTFQETEISSEGIPFIGNNRFTLQSFPPYKSSLVNDKWLIKHPDTAQLYRYYLDHDGDIAGSFLDSNLYLFKDGTWDRLELPPVIDALVNFYFNVGDTLHIASVDQEKLVTWKGGNEQEAQIKIYSGDVFSGLYHEEQQSIYMGTDQGLLRYHINSHTYSLVDSSNSLPCFCLVKDTDQNIWFSSINQIFMYSPTTDTLIHYEIADGARSFIPRKCSFLSLDSLLFYHTTGVTLIQPSKISPNKADCAIQFLNLKINDILEPYSAMINYTDHISKKYQDRTISFDVVSNDLADASNTRIKYMLKGYDEDWIYSEGNAAFVRYPRLPPGSYVFTAFGANSDGIWNAIPRELLITITPPFWMTWWFITLTVLALASLTYWAVKSYYQRKLEKKNQLLREQALIIEKQQAIEHERTRIASEMHDDLGSGLTTIRYLSDKALTQAKDAAEAQQIKKIADHSNALVRNMSEIIWAMNSRFDNAENLVGYLRRYASEFLEERNVPLKFAVTEDQLGDISIGGEKRRNLFLVFKEVLHNAVKYSGASQINIEVDTQSQLTIRISEINGKGFDPALSLENGNGLYNCQKRMKTIQGNITFEKNHEAMHTIITAPFNTTTSG